MNRRALLSTLEYFGVASGALVPDIMHDVLEGALPLEVKLMLKVCVYVHMYTDIYIVYMITCTIFVPLVPISCLYPCCCYRCLWLTESLLPLVLLMMVSGS